MDDRVTADLDRRLRVIEHEGLRYHRARVAEISPDLKIVLAAADTVIGATDTEVFVHAVQGLSLAVDDEVAVIAWQGDMLVIGKL